MHASEASAGGLSEADVHALLPSLCFRLCRGRRLANATFSIIQSQRRWYRLGKACFWSGELRYQESLNAQCQQNDALVRIQLN